MNNIDVAKSNGSAGHAQHVADLDWLKLLPPWLDPEEESVLGDLDGALLGLTQHIVSTAVSPQPWLALGASLAAIGALMGRRYRTPTNLRSNIYVLNLAPSSAGKDHARGCIKEAFVAAGLEKYLGGERLASGAGVMAALKRHPAAIFQLDEFGKFAACICDRKAPKHLIDIWDRFTELATSAGGTWLGTEYANQKENPREVIAQPCCCLHATSVGETFWAAMQHGSRHDGSLARFLLFESRHYPDRRYDAPPATDVPRDLIKALQAIAKGNGTLGDCMAPDIVPTPRVVPMTPEAQEMLVELDADTLERLRLGRESQAVLGRRVEHTLKLALISAVSASPRNPVIDAQRFEWAQLLTYKCVEDLLCESEEKISDNDEERNKKRLLAHIREAGETGITASDLTHKTRWAKSRERNEMLMDLAVAGIIKEQPEPSRGGRRACRYFFEARS